MPVDVKSTQSSSRVRVEDGSARAVGLSIRPSVYSAREAKRDAEHCAHSTKLALLLVGN
jgi:hypothetical protein